MKARRSRVVVCTKLFWVRLRWNLDHPARPARPPGEDFDTGLVFPLLFDGLFRGQTRENSQRLVSGGRDGVG